MDNFLFDAGNLRHFRKFRPTDCGFQEIGDIDIQSSRTGFHIITKSRFILCLWQGENQESTVSPDLDAWDAKG